MPDNWGFVAAAYLLTALVLGAYWRRLVRREHEHQHQRLATDDRSGVSEPRAPLSGHPRPEPASRPPLQ
jgi:hypothetical protein